MQQIADCQVFFDKEYGITQSGAASPLLKKRAPALTLFFALRGSGHSRKCPDAFWFFLAHKKNNLIYKV